ncbi:MAG: prenyltransferase/squalene oxidase repeat-containing protein [Thermodesulfobacteriota bacterium]
MGRGVIGSLSAILASVIPFVEARRKSSGGFGATPKLPATIEDTYYALNILGLARQYGAVEGNLFTPDSDENLRSYLDGCRRSLSPGARTTFHLFWCCRTVGIPFDPDAVETAALDNIRPAVALEDWYYGARTLAEVLERKPSKLAGEGNLAVVLGHDWRSVNEAWMHIYLCRECRDTLPRPKQELIAWFRACQNGDGGFGFFPGTTSFVENCHHCLRALSALGAEPTDTKTAHGFLTSAQTARGGFGRCYRAAPFLYATWHAVAGLALLDERSRVAQSPVPS